MTMGETPRSPTVEVGTDAKAGRTSRGRMLLRLLLGVCTGALVASVVFYFGDVKPAKVLAAVAAAPLWAVAACMGSSYVMLALQSARWHAVMKPVLGLTYGQAYRAQLVGYLFNTILWLRGGDLVRVQYLGRRTGKSRATILGTEVVDRWLDLWGWIPTMLVLAAFGDLPPRVWMTVALFGALLVSWATAMVVLARRGWAPRPGSRLAPIYSAFRTGIEAFGTRRTLAIALFVAPLPWLWEATFIRLITPAFGIHVDFTQAFCVLVGFNIATALPSPGGMGTEEAGGVLAFRQFGVDDSKALAFMLAYHLSQMVPGVVTGAVVLASEGEHLFGKLPARPPPEA
jgi:uncharacterized protein (TIRG00374 family)